MVEYENWLMKEEQKKREKKFNLRNTMVQEMVKQKKRENEIAKRDLRDSVKVNTKVISEMEPQGL